MRVETRCKMNLFIRSTQFILVQNLRKVLHRTELRHGSRQEQMFIGPVDIDLMKQNTNIP